MDKNYRDDALTTLCDVSGRFEFQDIPVGSYYVTSTVVWQVGYANHGGPVFKELRSRKEKLLESWFRPKQNMATTKHVSEIAIQEYLPPILTTALQTSAYSSLQRWRNTAALQMTKQFPSVGISSTSSISIENYLGSN